MRVRLMAVVLLLLLAGCSSDGGRGDGRITLRFQSLAWQRESVEATKELVGEWNATHPDVRVEYVQGSWDGVHDQLLTSFEGGEAPDIIHDASDDLADFAYGGYLADLLPERLKSDIPQRSWETTTFGDGVYGVPFLQEPRVLVANATWLREAGVRLPTPEKPWSWDEFRAVTEELSGKGRYGVAWPLKEPVSATLNLSLSLGGRDVPPGRGRQGGDPLRRCRRGRPADRARPGEHRPQRGGHHARHGRLRHAAGVLRRPVRDGPARVLLPSADRAAGTRRIRLAGAARPGRRRRARPGRQSADNSRSPRTVRTGVRPPRSSTSCSGPRTWSVSRSATGCFRRVPRRSRIRLCAHGSTTGPPARPSPPTSARRPPSPYAATRSGRTRWRLPPYSGAIGLEELRERLVVDGNLVLARYQR